MSTDSFGAELTTFLLKVKARAPAVFVNTVAAIQDSIQHGSAATGSPGQPVDTGNLLGSWRTDFESSTVATISTNVEYAPTIEDNTRGAKLRSQVGGFHSVALTRAGFQRVVDIETVKAGGGSN